MKVLHGLPEKVVFCKRCVMSNQRPSTSPEHLKKDSKIPTAGFDESGVCHACLYADYKRTQIDWPERSRMLEELVRRFRRKDGEARYDVLVPGSGGKDSIWVSHLMKYKYGMNPLTVTWAPHLYTEIGWRNYQNWVHSGFDNYLHMPNGRVHGLLTRLAFENLCNPFQPFIMGQKYLMAKIAQRFGIRLIMYGENQAEYHNTIAENDSPVMQPRFYTRDSSGIEDLRFGSLTPAELEPYGIGREDLLPYIPLERTLHDEAGIEVHYTSYYKEWIPQEAYYFAVKYSNFAPNPYGKSEGTYSKYASLDDKIDGFYYYTMFTKFGQGRTTSDAAHEIRDGHITRDEGVRLVRKHEGKFPARHFDAFLSYTGITKERFVDVIDRNRSPHLWKRTSDGWELRHPLPG